VSVPEKAAGFARAAALLPILGFFVTAPAQPQEGAAVSEEIRNDTDPTKPVLFNLRDEYYNLRGGAWQNVFLLRADRLVLRDVGLPGGARGLLWIKPEIPWGPHRQGDWTLKLTLFKTRY
jgi:hypothetical protein